MPSIASSRYNRQNIVNNLRTSVLSARKKSATITTACPRFILAGSSRAGGCLVRVVAYLQSLVLERFGGAPLSLASTADRGGLSPRLSAQCLTADRRSAQCNCHCLCYIHCAASRHAPFALKSALILSPSATLRCKSAQLWLRYSYQLSSKNFAANTSLPRCEDRFAGQEFLIRRKARTEPPKSLSHRPAIDATVCCTWKETSGIVGMRKEWVSAATWHADGALTPWSNPR